MSAQRVCDSCGKTISGQPLITSTESDGQVFDFDTAGCFVNWRKARP